MRQTALQWKGLEEINFQPLFKLLSNLYNTLEKLDIIGANLAWTMTNIDNYHSPQRT
jgi:hypothetical protein